MNKIDIDIDKLAKKTLKDVGERVAGKAKMTVPISTGNLLSTIRYRIEENEVLISCGGQGYSKLVDYAPFVEDKTHFFSEAFDEESDIDLKL